MPHTLTNAIYFIIVIILAGLAICLYPNLP